MIYKNVDELAKQVGGSLRLTTLIISRARQIVKRASSPLIDADTDDPVRIAFLELMQSKIKLNDDGEQGPEVLESKKMESPLGGDEKS